MCLRAREDNECFFVSVFLFLSPHKLLIEIPGSFFFYVYSVYAKAIQNYFLFFGMRLSSAKSTRPSLIVFVGFV